MAETSARLGFGVKLKMGDGGSPESFTEIGEIRGDFSVGQTSELIEVTNHQSDQTSDGRPIRQYIAGAEDGEEITLTVNYDYNDATHDSATGVRSKKGQTVNFELHEPGATVKESFSAVVIGISRSYPVDDAMQMEVTLKPVSVFAESAA